MTDNEIIKALEMCAERIICLVPYEDNGTQFYQLSVGYILDLINRLQADVKHLDDESDALRADIDFRDEEINELQAENKRLRESCSHIDICCKNCKYLIRYRGSAPLIAQCTKGHKDFLPFDVGDSIETYYCRGFTPFKFNTTNEAEIKAEAYKEFAERLKAEAKSNEWNGTICGNDIDNLLNELVGE